MDPVPWGEILPFPVRGIEGHPLKLELVETAPGRVVASAKHFDSDFEREVHDGRPLAPLGPPLLDWLESEPFRLQDRQSGEGELAILSDRIAGDPPAEE